MVVEHANLRARCAFKSVTKAGAYLLKLTEHTWGLSDLYNKSSNWTNAELQRQIAAGDFDTNIKDWDLQRPFVRFVRGLALFWLLFSVGGFGL